jgi:hypothetical protein
VINGNPSLLMTMAGDTRTYTDNSCASGNIYGYHLEAVNAVGTSPVSQTATTSPQQATTTDGSSLPMIVIGVVIGIAVGGIAVYVIKGRKR